MRMLCVWLSRSCQRAGTSVQVIKLFLKALDAANTLHLMVEHVNYKDGRV